MKEPQDAILPVRGEVLEELTVATEEFQTPNFADKPGAFPNPCFKISGSQEGKGEVNKKAPNSFHSIKPLNHVKEIRSAWVAAKT